MTALGMLEALALLQIRTFRTVVCGGVFMWLLQVPRTWENATAYYTTAFMLELILLCCRRARQHYRDRIVTPVPRNRWKETV